MPSCEFPAIRMTTSDTEEIFGVPPFWWSTNTWSLMNLGNLDLSYSAHLIRAESSPDETISPQITLSLLTTVSISNQIRIMLWFSHLQVKPYLAIKFKKNDK